MSRSADLARLLRWRSRWTPELSWETVEASLGITFPEDYKELMSLFGTGVFERIVAVVSPIDNESALEHFRDEMQDILEIARNNEPLPHRLFPEPGGLIPWADAGDSCTLFWRTDKGGPDEWTIVYCDGEFSEWEEFDGRASEFIFELISGRLQSQVLEFEAVDDPEFDPPPSRRGR